MIKDAIKTLSRKYNNSALKSRTTGAKAQLQKLTGFKPNDKEAKLFESIKKRLANAKDPAIKKALKAKRVALLKGMRNRRHGAMALGATAKVGGTGYLLSKTGDNNEHA